MACVFTAANYSKLFENNYALLLNTSFINPCWPGITSAQLSELARVQETANGPTTPLDAVNMYSTYILTPIGLVCSILCAIGFWRKAVIKRDRFYVWMLLTALLDFLFCAVTLIHKIPSSFPEQARLFQHSAEALWTYRVLYGIYRALVISSDLTALALAFERAVAVQRPLNPLTTGQMRIVTAVEVFLLLTLTAVRFYRYTFEQVVQANPNGLYSNVLAPVRNTEWFQALTLFSDFILVVIILVFMVLCSLVIAAAIWRRRHSRIHESKSTHQQLMVQKQSTAMLRLLAVILILYMASQITYLSYVYAQYTGRKLTENLIPIWSFEDLRAKVYNTYFWVVSAAVSVILSIFSRAMNFFFFYACCPTFRVEFRKALGRGQDSVVVPVAGQL